MKKPEVVKKGRVEKYPWDKLKKEGDFFELPKADESQAGSVRILAKRKKLNVSVQRMVKGGYLVELVGEK